MDFHFKKGSIFPRPEISSNIRNFSAIPKPLRSSESISSNTISSLPPDSSPKFKLILSRIPHIPNDVASLFHTLYEKETKGRFWLDSARGAPGTGRFSYMGSASGPHSHMIHYSISKGQITLTYANGNIDIEKIPSNTTFFHWISKHMLSYQRLLLPSTSLSQIPLEDYESGTSIQVPFPFRCGVIGYLSYEMGTEAYKARGVPGVQVGNPLENSVNVPDVGLIFVDRMIIVDHGQGECWVSCLVKVDYDPLESIKEWINHVHTTIRNLSNSESYLQLSPLPKKQQEEEEENKERNEKHIDSHPEISCNHHQFNLRDSKPQYLESIYTLLKSIKSGDAYELCLTSSFWAILPSNHSYSSNLDLYLHLRHRNSAPYAALWEDGQTTSIMSSSPERFVQVIDGCVSMKPIKGTRKRKPFSGDDIDVETVNELYHNEKDRAENLMVFF